MSSQTSQPNPRRRKKARGEGDLPNLPPPGNLLEDRRMYNYLLRQAKLDATMKASQYRRWTRTVVILAVVTIVYFYTKNQTKETKFAMVRENLALRMLRMPCSESYKAEMAKYPDCVPRQCGRFVTDQVIKAEEVEPLLELARKVISKSGGSAGGASVLDLHTGALSQGTQFVNVYDMPHLVKAISKENMKAYYVVKDKIKNVIAQNFDIPATSLYLTYPSFFSRLTNATAKTMHDEYWHEHVDKETYQSFHYTSLLYLNTFKKDFKGGRFVFVDGREQNRTTSTIEPKKGRLSAFTSGEENRHHVEKVDEGERFAVTISFTCDSKLATPDAKYGN